VNGEETQWRNVPLAHAGEGGAGLVRGREVQHVNHALIRASAVQGGAKGGEGGCYPKVIRMGLEVTLGGSAIVTQLGGAISSLPKRTVAIALLHMVAAMRE
jgi:hypothetical protein